MALRIGIIGAGFGGLTCARVFRSMGHDVVLYEKENDVGGVWSASRRYPGLTTQNPKRTYELSDFPMPDDYPEWPSGEQVQAYMQAYVEHFGLDSAIKLDSEVKRASYDEQRRRWHVESRTLSEGNTAEDDIAEFDYLIVANGIFSIPFVPDFPGTESFVAAGGTVCHTSEFTRVEDARDKHVLVVGYGKSSCDMAMGVADTAASTAVVARHLIWKLPKWIGGKLNYKHLFLSRLSEALFRYVDLRGMDRFLHTWGNPLRQGMLNSVEWIIERQLGLRRLGLHPGVPLETIARSTVSLVTDGFYEAIAAGRIAMHKHTEIVALEPGRAILGNGDSVPADIVVCGTGWQQRCDFLDESILSKVTDENGNFRLFRSMIPVDVPGLAFNGYNSSFFSQLNCEMGAIWLVDFLHGGFSLPSACEQNADIDRRLAWMEQRTGGKHSKGTNIIPFSIHHIDELLSDMRMNVGLRRRFVQWFGALQPSVYRDVLPLLQAKHKRRPAAHRLSGQLERSSL
ncbi:MAG: NAD(P)/FAD-dependent oxidoreductase [Pseudomonadota bacterium]